MEARGRLDLIAPNLVAARDRCRCVLGKLDPVLISRLPKPKQLKRTAGKGGIEAERRERKQVRRWQPTIDSLSPRIVPGNREKMKRKERKKRKDDCPTPRHHPPSSEHEKSSRRPCVVWRAVPRCGTSPRRPIRRTRKGPLPRDHHGQVSFEFRSGQSDCSRLRRVLRTEKRLVCSSHVHTAGYAIHPSIHW